MAEPKFAPPLGEAEENPDLDYTSLLAGKKILEEVINSLPGIFVFMGEDLCPVCWNRNFEVVSGYPADEIAKMKMTEFFRGGEMELFEKKAHEALESGASSMEIHILSKSGDLTPYSVKTSAICINCRRNLIFTGNELCERYELERPPHQLSQAIEEGAVSIMITDTKGTIEYVNKKFCNNSGYSLEEIIGSTPRILKSGMTPEGEYKRMWDTITAGGEWRGEFHNKKKNGETFWEFETITPLKNPDDIITHFLAVKEDITERKRVERELHKCKAELLVKHEEMKNFFIQVEMSKREWENTMDCIRDIVILTDPQSRIKRCNNALAELTGLPVKEITGRNWQALLKESGLLIPSSGASGKEFCHKPTGKRFVFHSYPFTDNATKEVTGSVITLHDNAMIKQLTSEPEKAHSDLKATQEKVAQHDKTASIGQPAAGEAKEINDPMGLIANNLGTLGKYLERLEGFVQAQWDLIEMITDDSDTAGLREKRKAMKLDYILENGKELIEESLDCVERVRTIVP